MNETPWSAREERARPSLSFPFPRRRPTAVVTVTWTLPPSKLTLTRSIAVLNGIAELAELASHLVQHSLELTLKQLTHERDLEDIVRRHSNELKLSEIARDELFRLSTTDVMTGVLNRRGFFLQAEQNLRLARRQCLESAVVFADIDDLKYVNDRYGHQAGDDLIKQAAKIFRHAFRECDVIARIGGDEFAAFTINSDDPQSLMDRLNVLFSRFNANSVLPYPLSMSVGIVRCPANTRRTLSNFLFDADRQMYEAKGMRRHPHSC